MIETADQGHRIPGLGDNGRTLIMDQFMAMLREYHEHRTAIMTALVRREILQSLDHDTEGNR